jgi:hypothetical protein
MIWLDTLLAVPAIGVRLRPDFKEIFDFQKRLGSFIDFLIREEKFEVEKLEIKSQDIWGYSISVQKTGFSFTLTPKDITGQYLYEIHQTARPGGLPTLELPETMPYTQLFEKVFRYLQKVFTLIKDLKGFQFDRIGIVTNIGTDKESLPPGVLKWIENLSKPWGGLTKSESSLVAKLHENEEGGYLDQCHHNIKFDDTVPEAGIRFTLDWQRIFKKSIFIGEGLSESLASCKDEALAYFQKFGEGELNYD